jgi:hypothetical protein
MMDTVPNALCVTLAELSVDASNANLNQTLLKESHLFECVEALWLNISIGAPSSLQSFCWE